MSARIRRFGAFGSGSSRGKAAGAVIACAVMLLAGCGGSGGSAADASAPVIRGDVGADAAAPSVRAVPSVGQVVLSWNPVINPSTLKIVIGYEVQVLTGTGGSWTGAGTGCATSATAASKALTCTATGLAAGTYSFRVAAVTRNHENNAKVKTGSFSQVSPVVTVITVAGTPATPTVVAGDSKVTVTVAAGTATDGTLGGDPTSYTVTASPAVSGGTCTVSGASGFCDVTGLTNGTAYTFTATAKNTPVDSPASAPSATVTPIGAPGQPGIGAVSSTETTTATVTFTKPSSDGGSPITTYTATSSPAGGTATLSRAGSGQITVTGLTAGTSYTFTVTATNAAGTSLASNPSASVTAAIVPLIVSSASEMWINERMTLKTSGGSGTGAVSYTALSASCHVVNVNQLDPIEAKTCLVRAHKAASPGYPEETSTTKSIKVQPESNHGGL